MANLSLASSKYDFFERTLLKICEIVHDHKLQLCIPSSDMMVQYPKKLEKNWKSEKSGFKKTVPDCLSYPRCPHTPIEEGSRRRVGLR
jgi:hypothetical protein